MRARPKSSGWPLSIEAARANARAVEIAARSTSLEKRGSDFWGLCPLHEEKTPSFKVDPIRNRYHCFGCGAGGDGLQLYMELEDVSFPEAVRAFSPGGAAQSERNHSSTDARARHRSEGSMLLAGPVDLGLPGKRLKLRTSQKELQLEERPRP